jgi:hypothetical protein
MESGRTIGSRALIQASVWTACVLPALLLIRASEVFFGRVSAHAFFTSFSMVSPNGPVTRRACRRTWRRFSPSH